MKVGILSAGHAPRSLQPKFGDYADMFQTLLEGRGYDWRVFDVAHGDYPQNIADCAGYIVTGARAGVNDGEPWIEVLLAFLRAARGQAKLVGICFGHQAMAQAFGGEVARSPKGWGVGLHTYAVRQGKGWMDPVAAFSLSASHQDQVVRAPPGANVLAGNEFCPIGLVNYGDAMSCQLHPEFTPTFSMALIDELGLPKEQADAAVSTLLKADDHAKFANWIARFLAR